MATFNEEDRKWLYDTMKSKGINTGSYDDFKQCLDNDEDRQWYYDKGKELGLNLGSKEDFDGMMWENNPVGKTDGHTETPETVKVDGNTFTESQLEAVENGAKVVQQSRYGTPEYANEVIKDDLPDNPYAGMTRQQAVNAIGEKYLKEWYGKPGAYENIKSELASYNIASPSDYGHITAAIRNYHLQSVARQRVEQLLSPFKNVNSMTFDDVQEVLDSRATQKAIDEDVRNLGLEQEDKDSYYQELEKQLEKVLTDKYGYLPSNDGRGSVSRYASSLINGGSGMHEERIREREAMSMIQGYLKDDIDATVSDYDRQAQEVKESTLKSTGADYSVAGGSNAGMQLGSLLLAQREANKVSDPEKILKDLTERSKALFDKMLSDEAFISNVMKQSEALGIEPDQYVADYVIPSFMKSMQREFSKSMTARELPKGRLDYIMRGLTDDSIIGMLVQKFVMTDSQIQYRDMANAKYGEGANIWLQGARMATGMASDFWLWGGWGKLGGAATRSLLNQRIMALAASKRITREAATRIMEEEARQYLSKGLFEHIMRHVPQSAVTMGGAEATTEAVRGYTRNEEIGDVLLNTFKSGMSGAATGTAFGVTGGAASRLTSQLSGVKRLAGKLAGLEVEAATLYTTEELQKMLSGDDAFENPFEGMFEANVKLGFIKASANPLESAAKFVNAVAHPVKTVKGMMEPDSKVLTEEDVADLRETFDGKGLVDAVTTMRPVRHTDGSEREGYITEEKAAVAAQAYNDYMKNPDRPIDRKQRVARLLGGIVPPTGKEVRIDIDTTDGKTVLRTRDAKGQCVQELYFDSHQEAEDAANEMLYTIDQNTTTVLEDRISETAVYDLFRQKIDEEYQKVAAKYGDGVNPGVVVSSEMTETEKKWVYLHQHLDELLDITQAIGDGRELGIDGQNLAEQFLGMFVEYSSSEAVASDNANRLRNAFEQQYGLNPGELDEIIRKGPGKRSDVESTILGEYQEFLRKRISDDDAAGKTDGHTEGTEGQAGGEAGAVNGTGGNEPPAGPATPDGETVGNIVIGEVPGEGQAIARSERRQAAYDRGKQAVQNPASLAAITYDSHLASLRLLQQFPENDPVLSRLRKDLMKAIVEGNDDEAERLMDLNAGNMNSRQKEAVEQYRDAMEMSRGVDDAVTEAVQAFQRQRHDELRRIAAADGTVTELTLADGSKAYYISGDLNNKYSGVIVANEQGETKQTAVSRIAAIGESVPMDAILRADVDAYGQQLQQDLSGFASGTSLIPGSTVELGIGSYLVQVQYVGNDATGNMVFKEADGRQSVFTPQDVQQFVQEANRMKMESQLRQEKTAAVEQARADRFGKGIVGYSDGKADVSHKDTDAKVAAEYLEANVPSGETSGHSALLKSIQGEIDKLNELTERSRETVSRMAAKQELQGLSEQEEIALGESQAAIDDAAGRRRKWGEIRQALMTDEERRKFESERQKEIRKAMDAVKDIPAGKPLDTLAVPTGKDLLEQYEEPGDAENAVETLRANLKAQYRDDVYPRLASVREAIEDYRRGLSDLTTDEINELAVSQKQLESQETAMMKQSQELKNLASSLGRLYAGRKKQQLSPHEYKMQQLEKETNKAKKLNLAKEAFADDEEALAVLNDLEPQDIYEHIADNLGEGSLSWEGFDRGEHHVRGVVDMVGKDKKRGIGKDSDTIGYNTFLAPTGQGKGYDEVVHAISESSPYSTEDVANALYDMLSSASKPTDISHRIIDDRIARAEEIYESNREREREAEEDAKREALDQEIMQMTGMDPDEYDAYISDLESRLAEQEGYRSSEDYFNQTVERYEREQERNAGGSQETGALGLQGQEGEQGTGEGAAEEGAGGADAIAELRSDVNEFTSKYHSLPAEVISLDIPDAELIEKLGIPQYVIDHFGSEQKACEAVRNSLKEKKTVAAYNRESNKIIIFATAKRERIPEAMFHENVHGVLRGWYGDKEQSIATNFWNLSPDEGGKIDKSYIQKRYDEDEWKTEFFVTWLGRAMVDGTVDDMLKILSDPGDFERVNNILNAIGYDRAKETAERQGSGRLAEDNSSADGGRPEEGEVDAAGETDGHTEAQDFSARLAEAKSETNTNPTEEQKKAGNYKMGHISFCGYRMSIENPKGSTRSGKDANGKAWSIEMQDTYGYIGKKYGADGDHLDFFINDDADLDNWNGRVYVVDQGIPATDQAGKQLGTLEFDEHKVMYGYPSFKAAKEAYERNYEAGWWDKHVIGMTGVRKDTFDAWLNDSDHKRKPFAEYSRTRNAETITDNVDQLLADVRERAMKEIDELKNITTTYKDGELEKRSIAELEQLKKKRKQDASMARYSMRAFNIKAGSEKEHTLMMNEAQANADIKAIDEELKRKKEERQAAIEQQEMGFAVTDRLNEMGYDVETNPSEVRRVRKIAEKDQSEEGKMRHMQTTDGTVYGFVYRGKMYMDIRKIDGNLPLHEYAHPWCEAFRKMNPDGWKAVVKTMQTDKDTWEFVKQLNPDLKTEDDIAEEMIAKGTGEKGEQYARAEYERMHGKDGDWKSKWNNIWKNIAKAIQDFWKQVGDYLHIKYESPDQVYDQVIRDFANNVNPKKKMEQWLKERDKSYLEAVKTGDEAKAKDLFDAALRENIGSGIVPFVSTGGYRGKLQKLAHGVKSRDPKVIAEVADLMAPIIPKDAVLVPAPSHGGEATDMLDLANAISERTGAPVADVLKSKERGSQYDAKKAGKPLSTVDLGITIDGKLPEGKLPVVIDNVVDTGNTAEACVRALGKGIVASLADSKGRFKRVTTLKSAEPVVTDKKGNVVPLSKRFELPFQFMVEGNLFSDADFDEPETATEVALTGRRLNKYGLNEDTTIGKKLTEFLDKNDAPNLLAGYVDSKTGDYVILGESVNDIEEYADANQLKNAGDMDGMAYVRLTSKDFDILSPKLVKEGYKMAFVDDKTDKPTKPKDAVDTMLDEVERRKEVASQKESEKRVKEYLDKHVKGQDAEVRKRATKAVLKAMDKAGVPYKVVSKEEERQMMQIFSMMNQESVKAFCRRADIRSTSRHGFGRYCVYNMADPFAVPMYHEKLSNAKEDVKQLKRMAPQGAWEILDIGYADEVQNDKELTGKAADMNLAELQAEIETWHGSGAVFAQFDHSHMGEGAGSQTFGWGTYVSGSKKVAEGYAHANDGLMKYKGAIIEKDPYSDNPAERALFYADQEGGFDKAVKFLKDLIKEEDDKSIINDYKETIKALQDKDSWSDVDRVLYNVQIPDESEAYYLDYKEKIDGQKDIMEMIDNNLFSEGWKRQEIDTRIRFKKGDEQIILTPNQSGADLYEELKEAMGGPKEASQWLNKIGLTGIKYPAGTIMGGGDNATNYVIFNEKDAKIVNTIQFMMGEAQKEGERIMGWSDGKQVYLTEAGLNPNTPLHETTHLWDKWCQKEKPELWKKVVDAMKKTAMWEEISKNPNYRNIWNDDNRMASEVHARLSGAKGEDEFMKAAFKKDTPQSIINEVKSVLRKFWESILRLFGKTTKTIGDEWSSLDAIIRMPLRDLLNKDFEKVLSVVESEPSMQAQAHIETDKADMEHKQRQLEIVTKANPMLDDYHTGIRKLDDIKTFEEAYLEGKENAEEGGYDEYASYPDITNDMIEEARKTGKITIYSSKPIKDGVFVTPSMMNAKDYAGNGKVYSKEVPIEDVAWINLEEGQYAKGGDAVKMQKAGDDVEAPNEFDIAVRDKLIDDYLKPTGIDFYSDAEAEKILEEGKEGVKLNRDKKRALKTASVSQQEEHQPTVVSSASGAKVLKDLDNLVKYYENISGQSKEFIGKLSKALGATIDGSGSEYATFETVNGKIVTIRLADHNATVSNFDHRNELDGISIVITAKKNTGIFNDGTAHIVEFFYDAIKLRKADGKPLAEIIRSVQQSLYSGEYKDRTGLAVPEEVNIPKFFKTSDGEVYGFALNGKIGIDRRTAKADTPIHEYGHLWAAALRKVNPKEWENVVRLMKGMRELWDAVKRDYSELNTDDDIAEEVLTQYSGKRGRQRFYEERERVLNDPSMSGDEKVRLFTIFENVKRALNSFWRGVADFLHIHYTSAEQVADQVLGDLLHRVNPDKEAKKYATEEGRIKAAAERDGTYMQAPDGTRSKLSEKEWVAARTEGFKKWIGGDWEAVARHFLSGKTAEHTTDESLRGKLDRNGEPQEKYVQGYLERPRKPGKPKKKNSETIAEYFNRLTLYNEAIKYWPETEAQWKAVVYRHDGSAFPDETAIHEKWMQKYEDDLKKWKEDNALAPDAVPPVEKPIGDDADPLDYINTMSEWQRNAALWNTAPDKEDYESEAEAEVYSMLAALELKHHPMSYSARMKQAGASLKQIRAAVLKQKRYDQTTVKSVVDFAKNFMSLGFGDNIGRGGLSSILTNVKRAVGARSIRDSVDSILETLVDNHLRNLSNFLEKMTSVKDKRLNPTGVEVQGELDLEGQRAISEFRRMRATRMTPEEINRRLNELADKIMDDPENRSQWEAEYDGAHAALTYAEGIAANKKACADAEDAIRDAERSYSSSGRTYAAQQELLTSLHKGLSDLLFERIDLYGQLFDELGGILSESRERAHEFREAEKARMFNIHRLAAIDMNGSDANETHPQTWKKSLNNSAVVRFPLSSLGTFEQLMKQFGSRHPNGEGRLYNHFMRGFVDASNNEQVGLENAKAMLDAKASEVFGKKMRWSHLYYLERSMPTMDVSWRDSEGNEHNYTLSQGNMLAIYMWNKMHDGQMKLRKMDIKEEDVKQIKEHIDPRLIELADWIQEEFLPTLRSKYNKVHEKEFGASMAEIEDYFPLRIIKDSIQKNDDLTADPNMDSVLPSTTTGSIIKRTVNAKPLDILNTDALSLIIEHIEEMEHWAAFTHLNKDINTLLSYNRFKNQVKNMDTVYGSGDELWNTFRACCQITAGSYRPAVSKADKAMTTIARGVTGAKIAFRVNTAIKQLFSAPAFLSCSAPRYFALYFLTPKNFFHDNIVWGMANLPMLRKRWHSRDMGDTRLTDTTGYGYWHTQVNKWVAQYGMAPNCMVDVMTCAAGARSVYETMMDVYRKRGMDEEKANERALQDAAIAYNLTQQSSEGAFVSPLQKDRTLMAVSLTCFRNSPFAYTRQSVDALRNLKRMYSNRADMLYSLECTLREEEGLGEADAKVAARAEFKRALLKNMANLMVCAFYLPWLWETGSIWSYLAFGEDDELKKRMMVDVTRKEFIVGPVEGLTGGSILNTLWGAASNHEVVNVFEKEGYVAGIDKAFQNMTQEDVQPLPLFADMGRMAQKFRYDQAAAIQDLVNIAVQIGVGVNPQTVTDPIMASIDACRGDLGMAKEIELWLLRVIMVPTESAQNVYLDELAMTAADAKKLSYDELAERYADYRFGKNTPMFGWAYSDEGEKKRRDSYIKRFNESYLDRIGLKSDSTLKSVFDSSSELEQRKALGKEIASRNDSEDNWVASYKRAKEGEKNDGLDHKAGLKNYITSRSWNDIIEDMEIVKAKREAKANGDEDALDEHTDYEEEVRGWIWELGTAPYNDHGTVYDDAKRMKEIREVRKEFLEKIRIKSDGHDETREQH